MSLKLNQIVSQIKADCGKKARRSSKISAALKTRFLEMLQDQGTTIKYAAKHLCINYSTAKVIAKENRHLFKEKLTSHSDYEQEYLPSRQKKVQVTKKELPRCSYVTIEESEGSTENKATRVQEIQIISTVAWNFLECGLPFVEPFEK